MRTLSFRVNGQKLARDPTCDFTNIVKGSRGYLRVQFTFDETWDGMFKAAEFNGEYAVLILGDVCDIPDEATDGRLIELKVVGKIGDLVINTNKIKIRQGG